MSSSATVNFGHGHRTVAGELVYGIRLENRTTRHAEYTITVTEQPLDPNAPSTSAALGSFKYVVEVAWGSIGKGQQFKVYQVDPGSDATNDRNKAISFAKQLSKEKQNRSYVPVDEYARGLMEEDQVREDYEQFVTDDEIVGIDPSTVAAAVVSPDCSCAETLQDEAWTTWAEPIPADATIAPFLMQSGYELLKYPTPQVRPRWVVGSDADCSDGYPHVVAAPVGLIGVVENVADPVLAERSTPTYIGQTVLSLTAKDERVHGLRFSLIVEEDGLNLIVLDALKWDGNDIRELGWLDRRRAIEQTFSKVFPQISGLRKITLAPRVTERLRETYLAENESARFELYAEQGRLGQDAWLLP